MDKAPPARQTRPRPMTIEAGPSYFSHDWEASAYRAISRRRVLLVSRVRHLFGLQWTSLVEVAISLRIRPAPLGALSSRETTSCQLRWLRLTCISAAKLVPHENVMSREEIIGRDDECYGHRRRRLLIPAGLRRSKLRMQQCADGGDQRH